MDSLTQITLGAAMGEVVLGKKIGNRAMIWGAIGGTIPDLDVLANIFMNEIDALAFHRGIMHSFLFAFTMPFLFGWMAWRFYESDFYKKKNYKGVASTIWMILLVLLFGGINYLFSNEGTSVNYLVLLPSIILFAAIGFSLYRNYFIQELVTIKIAYKDWVWLFFWSIFTHPLLDAFTPYGTQLFQPFSDYRVAFNNISVVDPVYTVPFLILVIIASRLSYKSKRRSWLNWVGIGISSVYMLFTIANKFYINNVFEKSLEAQELTYHRYRTAPTIFNNVLWTVTAETDSSYYFGYYSHYDESDKVDDFIEVPKNHHYLDGHQHDRSITILKWFTNGYYNLINRRDGRLQMNDMRYGSMNAQFDEETDYVFPFILEEKDGQLEAHQERNTDNVDGEAFSTFFSRVWGNKD